MMRWPQRAAMAALITLLPATALPAAGQGGPSPSLPGIRLPVPTLGPPPAGAVDGLPIKVIGQTVAGSAGRAEIVSLDRIWDQAPHNAFTDLIRFRERWYCAFREGSAHVSPDGAVRVISSSDAVHWSTAWYVSTEYADLRDPKLSITGDQRLMLSVAAAYNPPTEINLQSLAWYSRDGRDWGISFKIGEPGMWLWRVAWHRGSAFSMAYSTLVDRFISMYVGPAGLRFHAVTDRVLDDGQPSEATLLFNNDDSALCLLRRDGGAASAWLGRSEPPYRGWRWRDLGKRLGGPAMARLPDGRLVAAGRLYDGRNGPRFAGWTRKKPSSPNS